MPRLNCVMATAALSAMVVACGAPSPQSTRKSTSASDTQSFSTPTDKDLAKPAAGNLDTAAGFFLDEQDFALDDIAAGLMPCGGADGSRTLDDYNIKAWPEEMREFLAEELARYPDVAGLGKFFHGFYLSDTTLSDDIDENSNVHIDGLTCQKGEGGKLIVFINYDVHVRQREEIGEIDRLQDLLGMVDRYTIEESPDPLVATIFHELFHVVDFGKFASLTTGEPTSKRINIADYSWESPETPLYERIDILYLAPDKQAWYANHSIHEPGVTHFPLVQSGPTAAKEDFEYLEEETNFLTPYSMTNMYEDLASTMEIYYTGTRYDGWPVRKIYDADISEGTEGKDVLHIYDTKKIATSSKQHREKICAMAELVLGESCDDHLD